jgi:hypothetical protein
MRSVVREWITVSRVFEEDGVIFRLPNGKALKWLF